MNKIKEQAHCITPLANYDELAHFVNYFIRITSGKIMGRGYSQLQKRNKITTAEIARCFGTSKQNVDQLIKKYKASIQGESAQAADLSCVEDLKKKGSNEN